MVTQGTCELILGQEMLQHIMYMVHQYFCQSINYNWDKVQNDFNWAKLQNHG